MAFTQPIVVDKHQCLLLFKPLLQWFKSHYLIMLRFFISEIEMHTVRPMCYFSWFGKHTHVRTCTQTHTVHPQQPTLFIDCYSQCPLLFRFWTINNPIVYLMVNVIQNRIVFCHLKPCCAMTLSNRGQCPRPCGSISGIKARLINSIFSPLLRLSWIYMI